MAITTVKRVSSDYLLQTADTANGNIVLDSGQVFVTGNLVVQGNTTTINTEVLDIEDPFIRLNIGDPGPGVTSGFAGIGVNRGSSANVFVMWVEQWQKWTITNDGTNYANILASTAANLQISGDPEPTLGGNLNTRNYTIFSNSSFVNIEGNLKLNNVIDAPTAQANATVVYASTPAGGTSGVYVVNGVAANQELVTKTRAFGFSLIL